MYVENFLKWTSDMMWKWMFNMDDIFSSVLVFLTMVFLCFCIRRMLVDRKLPPGPWGLPIVGYYFSMWKGDIHLQYEQLAKQYGSIFSTRLGNHVVVGVSDYRVIRDMFKREEFTGRPNNEIFNILGGFGIINAQGKLWRDQRRFLHDKLRGFGMTLGSGRRSMETRIMAEVSKYLQCMAQQSGAPTNISPALAMSVSNIICNLLMGVRFTQTDKQFTRFMSLINQGFQLFGRLTIVNYIPLFRHLPGQLTIRNKINQNRVEMAQFFQETVDDHRKSFDEGHMRDLVDSYLLEIKTAEHENREKQLFEGKDHNRHMHQILGDLFSAGMETVKTTLEWAMILMLHHPEAARAVQEELDQVVGRSRLPSLDDLPFLPITEATICEVLRRSSIVPLGTTHATTRETNLQGYTLPTGTQIVPLLHAVHMDPSLWDKPTDFRPSRFINEEGKVIKPEYFMPFGAGRRMCLGDTLAKMELFLFFSATLHKFDLRLPQGKELPSLKGNAGVTVTPDPFQISLIERTLALDDAEPSGIRDRNVGSH